MSTEEQNEAELSDEQARRLRRINRYWYARNRRAPKQQEPKILPWFALGVVLIMCAIALGIELEWSPGNQKAIARAYRASRHDGQVVTR